MTLTNAPYMVAGETLILVLDARSVAAASECRWRDGALSLGQDTYGPLDASTIELFQKCSKAALADRDHVDVEDGRLRLRAARVFPIQEALHV